MGAAMLRQTHAAVALSIVVVLFLLTLRMVPLARLDPQLSARFSAAQIGLEHAPITYSYKLQRAWQYQLNFYLHREIAEWSPEIAGEAVVVTSQKNLPELRAQRGNHLDNFGDFAAGGDRDRQAENARASRYR